MGWNRGFPFIVINILTSYFEEIHNFQDEFDATNVSRGLKVHFILNMIMRKLKFNLF